MKKLLILLSLALLAGCGSGTDKTARQQISDLAAQTAAQSQSLSASQSATVQQIQSAINSVTQQLQTLETQVASLPPTVDFTPQIQASSALITQLQTQLDQAKASSSLSFSNYSSQIQTIQGQLGNLATLTTTITQLQDSVASLQAAIDAQNSSLAWLYQMKVYGSPFNTVAVGAQSSATVGVQPAYVNGFPPFENPIMVTVVASGGITFNATGTNTVTVPTSAVWSPVSLQYTGVAPGTWTVTESSPGLTTAIKTVTVN